MDERPLLPAREPGPVSPGDECWSRRDCLKALGLLAAGGAAFAVGPSGPAAAAEGAAALDDRAWFPGPDERARVSLVQGASVEDNVRLAIALAGGLAEIGQGQSVVIKPNCVWYTGAQTVPTHEPDAPITTDPEVLRAVIRAVKERNQAPERILVADHAGFLMSTTLVMKKRGLYDVALEEGVQVKGWEDTPHARFSSPRWEYLSQPVDVSETLLGCDHFINVPVLKNHSLPVIRDQAQYSCCLKAFVGTISARNRLFNRRMFHEWNLPEKVAELNLIRPWRMPDGRPGITMNVVDATRVIVSGGPHNSIFLEEMKVAEPGMILASRDRVACDTVALSVLKHHARLRQVDRDYTRIPVWQQRQIVHAARLGLGIADPARIDILTRGLPSALEQSILAIWSES